MSFHVKCQGSQIITVVQPTEVILVLGDFDVKLRLRNDPGHSTQMDVVVLHDDATKSNRQTLTPEETKVFLKAMSTWLLQTT